MSRNPSQVKKTKVTPMSKDKYEQINRKYSFAHSPSIARHRVLAIKSQDEEVRKFRAAVRDVYHLSDRYATYQQTSVMKIPPEMTSDRYILGQSKRTNYADRTRQVDRNQRDQEQELSASNKFDINALMERIKYVPRQQPKKENISQKKLQDYNEQEYEQPVIEFQGQGNQNVIIDNHPIPEPEYIPEPHEQPEEESLNEQVEENQQEEEEEEVVDGQTEEQQPEEEEEAMQEQIEGQQHQDEEAEHEQYEEQHHEEEAVHEQIEEKQPQEEVEQFDRNINVEEETHEPQDEAVSSNIDGHEFSGDAEADSEGEDDDIIPELEEDMLDNDHDAGDDDDDVVIPELEEDENEEDKAQMTGVYPISQTNLPDHHAEPIEPKTPQGRPSLPDLSLADKAPTASPKSYKSLFSPRQPMMFPKLDPNDPSLVKAGDQLLEISIRPFLYSLSNKYGRSITKLRDIPEYEMHDWKSMGFQWVWLYGAWTLGQRCLEFDLTDEILLNRYNEMLPGWTKEDVIGYPLSIVDYKLNPELGTMEDLVWFREQLKQRGMRLMLDFVPNDTAIDAPEMISHPDYYICASDKDYDENGNINLARFMPDGVAYGAGKWMPPMRFTAQLNIFKPEVREMQIQKLLDISEYCDGVRVHLAQYLITDQFATYWTDELDGFSKPDVEFWKEAIDRVRHNYPDFVMMAESYGYENQEMLLNCGFNYIYEKELIDHLANGDIAGFRNLIFQNHFITKKMVHFIENHDEPRSITRFWGNQRAAMAATVALLTLPGIRLINFHQWLGYKNQIDVNLRRALKEPCDQKTVLFYSRLFRVLETNAIRYGTWEPLPVYDAENVVAWKWVKDNQHLLVTVNFSNNWSGGRVICNDAPLEMREIDVHEMIYNTTYVRDPQEMRDTGLVLYLEAYQSQIFEY